MSLDNGIPNVTYDGTSSAAAVLDTTTYSFSVDSKPVEVVVQNDAITKVSVNSAQVGTAAGTYSVGTQKLKLSYANGSLTAQNASSVSPTISSVATYTIGDTTVTVDSSGQLSQTTATVNGQTATLTYSAETKKITASYTVSTSGNSGTYTVTLPDDSTVAVKVENGAISSVTYDDKEITATEGKYSVTTTGGTNYALSLNYADSNLTATTTTTIDELTATSDYTVAFGDDSTTITVKDNKLYQGTTELTATNDVYTVTFGSKEVNLKYDATNGLQTLTNVVDLSTLTADYEAKDGDILTGTPGSYKISIADGATVTLSDVTITGNGAAGITCLGNATIILEGTNTVTTGADNYAGIQAGGTGTTLTIKGTGSLDATGSEGSAGIGSSDASNSGNENKCGNIVIENGTVTATGGDGGAGIGSGYTYYGTIKCGKIEINGGNVTATGGEESAGIGEGRIEGENQSTSGDITITNTVTKVTATKGEYANNSIGTNNGTVTIGDKTGAINDNTYTYTGDGGTVADISTTTTQTATINGTAITFTTDSTGAIKYTVGNDGEETTATIADNTFIFKVDNTDVTATVADGKVTKLSYDTYDPATTTKLEPVTITYEHTATLYTFTVNGNDISVSVDSDGNITYNAQAVTDNKITVDGKEVTLTVSDGKITGASYFGEYSTVTEIEQVDVYKVTIDGQEVSCTFDTNNQCTVKVGEKNYLVTKTTNGATITSTVAAVGTEDSRAYLLAVGDGNYLISCTFDGSGNVTAVASDDTALSIIGTTIKIGDYTINISGTKDNLTTAATLKTTSESVEDVEVKQAFVLTGVKSTDGITVSDNVVTLTEANLNSQAVTLTGDGYTLALDKNYSATTIAPHFDGMTYKSAGMSGSYELSNNAKSINYVSETPATDLFTLTGVKSTDGITVSDNVVTLTEANLNNQAVTLTGDGYTLALDKNYSATTIAPHFDGMTYKSAGTSEGYELSNNAKSISYVSETPATDLFTLTGVKSTDGITVSDNVVTLTEANLNSQKVTIAGDGYTLSLAEGINEPTFNAGGWTLSGTTATYTGASNSEGYTLSDDAKTVTYTGANDEGISLKVYGVKSTDGLTLSGNVVTVAASSLDKQKVTISEGYTLAIADDVEQASKKSKQWTQLDKDTYLYTSDLTTAGYTLSDNEITYSEEIGKQYSIKGAASTKLISQGDDTEEVKESSLNRHKVILIETENHNSKNKLKFYGEDYAQVTIGAGRDSFITYDGARADVDLTNADNVTIVSFDGEVALKNYDMEKGAVVLVQDVDDIVDAIKTNTVKLVGNEIQINESSRVAINESNSKSTIVKLINYDGETQAVGFTGINGGTVNSGSSRENFLLKGNYAEKSSDVQKNKPSNLISGDGHDTILAGARDFVDGGNGKNQIFLTPHDLRQKKEGATVVSANKGRHTVHGFHEGFDFDSDVIQVDDFNNLKFKFDTDGLSLIANDSRLTFDGVSMTSATEDTTTSLGTDKPELIQLTDGSATMYTAIAQPEQSVMITDDETPNAFFGERSGLNFSDYRDDININLSDGTGTLDNNEVKINGFNKLQAGKGMSTLIGDETRNTLIAGTGYTSMWGGAGNDKLIGQGSSADKKGRTNFFFFAGDGRDVISNFTFLNPENRFDGIDDKINITDTNEITEVFRSGDDVVLQINNSNDYLSIKDAVGKDFRINDLVAKVDENIHFDGIANCYVAVGGSSLIVDSSVSNAEIWLDDSHGTTFIGYTRTLDASAVEGNTSLVGNELNNTIIAGQGDASLWGGFSLDDDLLIGGNSRNTFFYCMGNGNDTIQGTNDKDLVILSDISLDQIIEANIFADSVSIRFIDGGSLQIQGTADVTYQLTDGSKYSANHERLEWDNR